jgi:hypothetical protein
MIGPTPGTVLRFFSLSANTGSRSRELTRAYSVFCNRTIVSRLSFSSGRMLVDPSCEDGGLHRYRPGFRKPLHPAIEFTASCLDCPLPLNLPAYILDAVADRLMHIKSDVVHMSFEEPPWLFSESTFRLSSAFLYTTHSSPDLHSNNPLGTACASRSVWSECNSYSDSRITL